LLLLRSNIACPAFFELALLHLGSHHLAQRDAELLDGEVEHGRLHPVRVPTHVVRVVADVAE
jgi:hypothetical protein